jgi:hypothetical protein
MIRRQSYIVVWLTFFAKCSTNSQKPPTLHILDARPDDNIYFNYLRNADRKKNNYAHECYTTAINVSNAPPIYWVNMDRSRRRAATVVEEFEACGINNHRRIRAFDGSKAEKSSSGTVLIEGKLHISSKLELRNTRQLASVASHLLAISTAVRDQSHHAKSNPYALILEDDVSFYFNTDFAGLIASAPSDFGILQLTQSVYYLDVEGWNSFQKDPRNNMWTFRDIEKEYFSLQAYVINKEKLRTIVEKLMTIVDATTGQSQSQSQSQSSKAVATMKRKERTNLRHEPILVDIDEASTAAARVAASTKNERRYEVRLETIPETESSNRSIVISPELIIYHLGGPTYVLNIPLIRPLDTGKESLVFDGEDIYHRLHKKSDDFKAAIVRDWMSGGHTKAIPALPQFLSLPAAPKNATQIQACLREKSKLKSKKGQTTSQTQTKGKGSQKANTSSNKTIRHSHRNTLSSSNRDISPTMKSSPRGSETMGVHLGA